MATKSSLLASASIIIFLSGGCTEDIYEELIDSNVQALLIDNDTVLNGVKFNGVKFNGVTFNGVTFNGVTLNGTALSGIRESDGTLVSGADFVGADFDVVLEDSTSAVVRITAITSDPPTGLNFYTVRYNDGNGWQDICAGGVQALPVEGTWDELTGSYIADPDKFTFACRGAALAKCIEWGYERDAPASECRDLPNGPECHDVDMRYLHEACTRMVRGDYCGDGVVHTADGTLVDVWDTLEIQVETANRASDIVFEAEWSSQGATCVSHTRWAESKTTNSHKDYILSHCPARWAEGNPSCGGSSSPFFAEYGYLAPMDSRPVVRSASRHNYSAP